MKTKTFALLLLGIFASGAVVGSALTMKFQAINDASQLEVGFSPKEGAQELVLSVIGACRKELRMATYDFTSEEIANAVIAAKKRGVDVAVVSDKRGASSEHTQTDDLKRAGVPVKLNGKYAIHHHKFITCDGRIVETGSFNYTNGAIKRNAENVLVLWDHPRAANLYRAKWQYLWDQVDD